jgi:TolA-binding protein
MGQFRKVLTIAAMTACLGSSPAAGQQVIDSSTIQDQLDQARRAMEKLKDSNWQGQVDQALEKLKDSNWQGQMDQALEKLKDSNWQGQMDQALEKLKGSNWQGQLDQANRAMEKLKDSNLQDQLDQARRQMELAGPMLDQFNFAPLDFGQLDSESMAMSMARASSSLAQLAPGLAFAPFQGAQSDAADRAREAADRAREQADRLREMRDRARENADRGRESEDRRISVYRSGTDLVDEGRYERAIPEFDKLIEVKWPRADGAFYWKAYALNKLGKRDEALAALAEIPKQYPQSRWINDAKALQVEIQTNAGRPVSPDSITDEDLRLLAISALMNSEPERAVPLLEKVLNDPKNSLALKAKALFVLAQSRNDKSRDIVAQYAKNGSNPDLQIRAVQYLGSYRSANSQQILADIYTANTDVAVRRAVLRRMANSRDSAHLLSAAKTESNVDLRREAIRGLGNMQAANELGQLYGSETNAELKASILQSLMSARGTDKLIEIAKTEKDPTLRGDAIRYLGNMRGDKTADALAAIYPSEADKNVKGQIIRTLGSEGAGKQLVDVTRNEKDRELKAEGMQWLGRMHGSKEATDYLIEVLK